MAVVYILQSEKNKRYYVGSTNNLERRLKEHNSGKTLSIRFTKPYSIVFSQEFDSIELARKIELRLKKYKSRKILEKIIQDKVIKQES